MDFATLKRAREEALNRRGGRTGHVLPHRAPHRGVEPPRFRALSEKHLDSIPQLEALPADQRFAMRVIAQVLPFRVNAYVLDELIDWSRVPDDPIYQLTFPQPGMLSEEHFDGMADLLRRKASREEIGALASEIRAELNPHPAGQRELNVPVMDGRPVEGVQHKYDETVLFFPAQGQTCHAYCTFCFRWAQFIGDKELKFAASDAQRLVRYLKRHPRVTDVLITGGDPMVMTASSLAPYIDALLDPALEHVRNIRIGSKSLTYWPQRFVTDRDADELLALFDRVVRAGKHLAFMTHVDHHQELEPGVCRRAIRRIRSTGAVIRSQAPLLRHVNDDAEIWAAMWEQQVRLGIVPYYMFVERDTGARRYFELPLAEGFSIYREAIARVSGLARTARGPSMSAGPGKVQVQGVAEIHGEKVFVLRFIQARDASWVQRPFFAKYDDGATWLDDLQPAYGARRFFFEDEYARRCGAMTIA